VALGAISIFVLPGLASARGGSGVNCTTADLIPGAAVEEIDLEFRGEPSSSTRSS
jgi:hypothetical protein